MLRGHLPRITYPRVYFSVRRMKADLTVPRKPVFGLVLACRTSHSTAQGPHGRASSRGVGPPSRGCRCPYLPATPVRTCTLYTIHFISNYTTHEPAPTSLLSSTTPRNGIPATAPSPPPYTQTLPQVVNHVPIERSLALQGPHPPMPLQGYLAHEKTLDPRGPPRTLGIGLG